MSGVQGANVEGQKKTSFLYGIGKNLYLGVTRKGKEGRMVAKHILLHYRIKNAVGKEDIGYRNYIGQQIENFLGDPDGYTLEDIKSAYIQAEKDPEVSPIGVKFTSADKDGMMHIFHDLEKFGMQGADVKKSNFVWASYRQEQLEQLLSCIKALVLDNPQDKDTTTVKTEIKKQKDIINICKHLNDAEVLDASDVKDVDRISLSIFRPYCVMGFQLSTVESYYPIALKISSGSSQSSKEKACDRIYQLFAHIKSAFVETRDGEVTKKCLDTSQLNLDRYNARDLGNLLITLKFAQQHFKQDQADNTIKKGAIKKIQTSMMELVAAGYRFDTSTAPGDHAELKRLNEIKGKASLGEGEKKSLQMLEGIQHLFARAIQISNRQPCENKRDFLSRREFAGYTSIMLQDISTWLDDKIIEKKLEFVKIIKRCAESSSEVNDLTEDSNENNKKIARTERATVKDHAILCDVVSCENDLEVARKYQLSQLAKVAHEQQKHIELERKGIIKEITASVIATVNGNYQFSKTDSNPMYGSLEFQLLLSMYEKAMALRIGRNGSSHWSVSGEVVLVDNKRLDQYGLGTLKSASEFVKGVLKPKDLS